eukprot:maker-scaffold_4-snap-gene-17.57-mRNA-1 protein AED:0.06 eAED:0.06 QI:9/1/1/1/1/1/6/149/255
MKRLAKTLAQQRIFSRREAERKIKDGFVKVNGKVVRPENGVFFVKDSDIIDVVGHGKINISEKQKTKLFMCYKLVDELVSTTDDAGRKTLFSRLDQMGLPKNLISVGRLDYKTQGLILLTNNGHLARQLELPSTGLIRKYKAKVKTPNGEINSNDISRLQRTQGLILDEVQLRPMGVKVESRNNDQGNFRWLEVSVTEGKYREVRRALESVNMRVKTLIRTEFGPFKLGNLGKGDVLEITRFPDFIKKIVNESEK